MNEELLALQKQIEDLQDKLNHLTDVYYRTNFIDKTVHTKPVYFKDNVYLPAKTAFFASNTPVAKQAAITAPAGGATVDTQARTAIGTIITTLQTLGLTS